jgi:hypothetical protein
MKSIAAAGKKAFSLFFLTIRTNRSSLPSTLGKFKKAADLVPTKLK